MRNSSRASSGRSPRTAALRLTAGRRLRGANIPWTRSDVEIVLKTAAAVAAGGAAGGAMPAQAQAAQRTPFTVPRTFIPIAGTDRGLPGAAHLLHRPQLRGARARDGLRPERASRRSSSRSRPMRSRSRRPGETIDHPYPTLTKNYHYEVELVARARQGRARHPGRARARPRLRLHGRPRHDAARPAARDGRREEAVGDRQELRSLGGARSAAAGARRSATSRKGAIWLKVNGQTKQNANLNQMIWNVAEQVSNLSQAFELMPGRHHLQRHAGERRPGGQGRRDGRAHRRAARHSRQGRLKRAILRDPRLRRGGAGGNRASDL